MCRILCVRATQPFEMAAHLAPFSRIARDSREYQGHGWGCAWLDDEGWRYHHDIRPIWEDSTMPSGSTRLMVVHARSAFRDEGIVVENNMPFDDGKSVFVFNGELRGVRIKAEGRIGAEKIFNFVRRFDRGDLSQAVDRGVDVINKRTRYVRAMNFFIATTDAIHVSSTYGEDPDYFQMQVSESPDELVICSERYGDQRPWAPFPNNTNRVY
jgi:predicted glutamine amidotransferase